MSDNLIKCIEIICMDSEDFIVRESSKIKLASCIYELVEKIPYKINLNLVLTRLALDSSLDVKKAVLQNERVPKDILIKMALVEKDDHMHKLLIDHKKADDHVLKIIAERSDSFINVGKAIQKIKDISILIESVKTGGCDCIREISKRDDLTQEIMWEIVQRHDLRSSDWSRYRDILENIAKNDSTPSEILAYLGTEKKLEYEGVLALVASNCNTPENILREFSERGELSVRRGVARNKSTPSDILENLILDPYSSVAVDVTKNIKASNKLLWKVMFRFLMRKDKNIHYNLEESNKYLGSLQETLVENLVNHPNTCGELLQMVIINVPVEKWTKLRNRPRFKNILRIEKFLNEYNKVKQAVTAQLKVSNDVNKAFFKAKYANCSGWH